MIIKKKLLISIILINILASGVYVIGYTAPGKAAANLILEGGYTAPSRVNTILTLGIEGLAISWVTPDGNDNHTQNSFKKYEFTVTCNSASCGNVNVTLDPK